MHKKGMWVLKECPHLALGRSKVGLPIDLIGNPEAISNFLQHI
jgi:hypothetical protein